MELFQYFSEHPAHLLYLIAGISFVVELTIVGLSGPLFFFAIACTLTGVLVSLGVISDWETQVLAIGVLTFVVTIVLWKPFKRFQNSGDGKDTSSDMIGRKVVCSNNITTASGTIRYSGIDWNARLDPMSNEAELPKETLCEITAVEGNVMIVKRIK